MGQVTRERSGDHDRGGLRIELGIQVEEADRRREQVHSRVGSTGRWFRPRRVRQRQQRAELQTGVELEAERKMRQLDLPGIGQVASANPRLENQSVRAVGVEVAGDDREVKGAGIGRPGRILFERPPRPGDPV